MVRVLAVILVALMGTACAAASTDDAADTTLADPSTTWPDNGPDNGPIPETVAPDDESVRSGPRRLGRYSPPPTLVPPPPPPDGADPTTGERLPSELLVGECLNLDGWDQQTDAELEYLTVVACDDPHDAEVFARVSLNDDPDSSYPGDEHVAPAADRVCWERFEGYVGMRYVDTRLEIIHLRPPSAAWVRGDRTVSCLLVNANLEPLVGSLAGEP